MILPCSSYHFFRFLMFCLHCNIGSLKKLATDTITNLADKVHFLSCHQIYNICNIQNSSLPGVELWRHFWPPWNKIWLPTLLPGIPESKLFSIIYCIGSRCRRVAVLISPRLTRTTLKNLVAFCNLVPGHFNPCLLQWLLIQSIHCILDDPRATGILEFSIVFLHDRSISSRCWSS